MLSLSENWELSFNNGKPRTMNRMLMLITICTLAVFSSCSGNNSPEKQKTDTVKLQLTLNNMLPVGWGVIYKATVDKIVEGNADDFDDTIEFGIIASKEYEKVQTGNTYIIGFTNSGEKATTSYLPAIYGTVSNKNDIWLITDIGYVTESGLRTFEGTAIMSDGRALFVWDFADSEAFYLDGVSTWDPKYLNKKICVEGELIQFIDGKSVIKNWKIVACE